MTRPRLRPAAREPDTPGDRGLALTIIIPVHGRPGGLDACLESLGGQEYPADRFEVIVVDDGSPSPISDDLLNRFRGRLQVRALRQDHAGPAAARNLGARHARGENLAFLDSDCLPRAGWLAALTERLSSTPGCAVAGMVEPGCPQNLLAATTDAITRDVLKFYNADPEHGSLAVSGNVAVSAAGFRAAGGFDETFRYSEDREFSSRWLAQGRRLLFADTARVRHVHPVTLRGFWRRHYQYGRGAWRYHRLCAQRGTAVTGRAFLSANGALLGRPFARAGDPRSVAIALLTVLSQVASGLGLVAEALSVSVPQLFRGQDARP